MHFCTMLAAQAAKSEPVRELLAWLPARPTTDMSVARCARMA